MPETNDAVSTNMDVANNTITADGTNTNIERDYVLPGTDETVDDPNQTSPLLHYYSPRLFGAPPQLTKQCDMRIRSAGSGANGIEPGPVGDFYLTKILQDATIANFAVGRARFLGGMASKANFIREAFYYLSALNKYGLYGKGGKTNVDNNTLRDELNAISDQETYKAAYGDRDNEEYEMGTVGELIDTATDMLLGDLDTDASFLSNISYMAEAVKGALDAIANGLGGGDVGKAFIAAFNTSMSVQRPFYEFEMDWNTYINNVKTMINSAVVMLGLQDACVRIEDSLYPIGMDVKFENNPEADAWANYRYISPQTDLGTTNGTNQMNGDTSQYISFMVDSSGFSDSFNNEISPSQLGQVANQGSSVGAEIAFLTNATGGSANDMTIKLAQEAREQANEILKNLSSGNGRFTASIASSMARSFVGEHTIYPEVFQGYQSTSNVNLTIHLVSPGGDAYSYLTNILVPIFFVLGMTLPQLSNNNAAAYSYPPVIQCNIPGIWGTRLGMIQDVQIIKDPTGKDRSINGYPLSVDIQIGIRDLQHTLMTAPMNKISTFLNNNTMFDYIAQLSGVDKYRVNGSMRTVTKLALAASWTGNVLYNVSSSLFSDWNSFFNKKLGFDRQ